MSHLSIDTLLEMIKGDAGELPVGREIVSPGKQHILRILRVTAVTEFEVKNKLFEAYWAIARFVHKIYSTVLIGIC